MPANDTRWLQRLLHAVGWRRPEDPEADRRARIPHPGDMPGIRIGGFPLVRTCAQGPMGELHLATDPATGMPVALKTVRFQGSELTRERFLRESAAAARLQHPDIVRTFAAGVDGEGEQRLGWIAMEWVAGSDLSRYLQAPRLLPEAVVLELGARVAEALNHAHREGVVHRDIKPANILVDWVSQTVKVSDFGCAHLTDGERSRSGLIVGSPAYMAPEQLAGVPVDGRADLYALGVLMFQLLTGRLPFESDQLGQLLADISQREAPALCASRPDLPPLLSDIIARSLAKSPRDRQPDGAHFARELRLMAQACSGPGGATAATHKAQ